MESSVVPTHVWKHDFCDKFSQLSSKIIKISNSYNYLEGKHQNFFVRQLHQIVFIPKYLVEQEYLLGFYIDKNC